MTHELYRKLCEETDAEMKAVNGHSGIQVLKLTCRHCGASRKQMARYKCSRWFQTFVDILGRKIVTATEDASYA